LSRNSEELGYKMLKKIKKVYGEVIQKSHGETIKEEYDDYGCRWRVRVDRSLFDFVWDYRDCGPFDEFGILVEVFLGCSNPASSLNEWWPWTMVLEFISSEWNLQQPSLSEIRDPRMIDLIIRFIRDENYYHKWCVEFDNWLKMRRSLYTNPGEIEQ